MGNLHTARKQRIFYIVSIALSVVAIAMIFLTSVSPKGFTGVKQQIDNGFAGHEIVFGVKDGDMVGLAFSFLAMLPYVLTIAGIVLLVIRAVNKWLGEKFDFLVASLFAVSAILFFVSNHFLVFSDNLVGKLFASFKYNLSYGLIVSGVAMVFATGFVVLNIVLREKQKSLPAYEFAESDEVKEIKLEEKKTKKEKPAKTEEVSQSKVESVEEKPAEAEPEKETTEKAK